MLRKKFSATPGFSVYKEQVKIDVTDEGLRIQLVDKAERVSFPSGSATLTTEAQQVLAEIARGICELPNPIKIGGHTDKHLFPPNSAYTNWELSADRANAARRVLEATCVKPEQIQRILGFADTEPLLPENPYAEANRRITIVVMRFEETGRIEPASDRERRRSDTPDPEKEDGDREAEKSRAQKKLSTEGAVSVGEPDQPPDHAIRTRESKRRKEE
jgi:chemotaxis protein MotB